MTELLAGRVAALHDILRQLTDLLTKIEADNASGKQANSAPNCLEADLTMAATFVAGAIGKFDEPGDSKLAYEKYHNSKNNSTMPSLTGDVELARLRYESSHDMRNLTHNQRR